MVRTGGNLADLKLWRCNGCGVIHMTVGKTFVNFEPSEFEHFTEAVVDLHSTSWIGESGSDLIDLFTTDEEATVH